MRYLVESRAPLGWIYGKLFARNFPRWRIYRDPDAEIQMQRSSPKPKQIWRIVTLLTTLISIVITYDGVTHDDITRTISPKTDPNFGFQSLSSKVWRILCSLRHRAFHRETIQSSSIPLSDAGFFARTFQLSSRMDFLAGELKFAQLSSVQSLRTGYDDFERTTSCSSFVIRARSVISADYCTGILFD